jgi:DNA-binding GntR family transcriptional regulator
MLQEEVDPYGEIQLSQATLAMLLGASRQSVNEALSELRRQGAIETGYRVIRVVDPDVLDGIVGADAPRE